MRNFLTLPLGITNAYLITGESNLLFDTGPKKKLKKLQKLLKSNGLNIKDIDYITAAHTHWDHIGSLSAIKKASDAKVMVHKNEREFLESSKLLQPKSHDFYPKILELMMRSLAPFYKIETVTPEIEISDDELSLQEYGIDGKILHTPGHSPGSLSLILSTGEAFVSDLLMGGFPKLNGPGKTIFYDDEQVLLNSWKKLLDHNVKIIFPAHGKPFSPNILEKEIKKHN